MLQLKLRELREFKDFKQYEIAQLLNVSNNAYSQYETNKRQMSHEALCTLADFFGVTTDYLLGRGEQELFLLTETEKAIITKYRALDNRGRQNVGGLLDIEYSHLEVKRALRKRGI